MTNCKMCGKKLEEQIFGIGFCSTECRLADLRQEWHRVPANRKRIEKMVERIK